jgi:hypothetical protein
MEPNPPIVAKGADHMTTTPDRQGLRHEVIFYARLTHDLRLEASGAQATADRAGDLLTPTSTRLERTRAEIMRRGYSQLAEDMLDLADEAQVYADDARTVLRAV